MKALYHFKIEPGHKKRVNISIDSNLLARLDKKAKNRSEFIDRALRACFEFKVYDAKEVLKSVNRNKTVGQHAAQ